MNLHRIQAFLFFARRQASVTHFRTRRRLAAHAAGDAAPYTLWTVDLATMQGELRVSHADPFDVSRFGAVDGEEVYANLQVPPDALAKEMLFDFRGAAGEVLSIIDAAARRAECESLVSLASD